MRIILKLIVSLVLIPFIGGYANSIADTFITLLKSYKEHWQILSGIISGIVLFPFFYRKKFIRTFEHEMTHLIFAKIFFGDIKSLNVKENGEGYVEYSAIPNPFIGLSPYFFPLFSVCISILIPLLNPAFSNYFYIASGFFLINHLLSSISEIFSLQPDIRQEGVIFSLIFICFFIIFFYGIILSEAISITHITIFLKNGLLKSISNLISIKNFVLSLLKSI